MVILGWGFFFQDLLSSAELLHTIHQDILQKHQPELNLTADPSVLSQNKINYHGNNMIWKIQSINFTSKEPFLPCHQFITHFPDSGAKPRKAVCHLE